VLGRWSKPHVATIPQTAIDELKSLIRDGVIMIDIMLSDPKEIAGWCTLHLKRIKFTFTLFGYVKIF
jgi:hypothetical protein